MTTHVQAERVAVAMGSGCEVLESAVRKLTQEGEKVGLVKVGGPCRVVPWPGPVLFARLTTSFADLAAPGGHSARCTRGLGFGVALVGRQPF
jgi:hypothetical protein